MGRAFSRLLILGFGALLVPACGGGGGGGSSGPLPPESVAETEPNDSAGTATPLGSAGVGIGTLPAGSTDVDYWSFTATGGDHIRIVPFAARYDQSGWDQNANPIRTTLFDSDGTTPLRSTAPLAPAYSRDFEIARFRVPVTGTYYLKFEPDGPGPSNEYGDYAFRLTILSIPALQTEAEAPGATGGNDTAPSAETIAPGSLYGYHSDGNPDFYTFTVTAPVQIDLSILAYRLARDASNATLYDPVVDLIDTDGSTILKSGDDDIFQDSGFRYQINSAGAYYVRVHENAGSSVSAPYYLELKTYLLGALSEAESNDSVASANAVTYGDLISGSVISGDTDYFSYVGTAGDAVQVYVMGGTAHYQGAPSATPPSLLLLNTDGISALTAGGPQPNHYCWRTFLTASGVYYIRVTTPSGTAIPYTLHVARSHNAGFETEPNDTLVSAPPLPLDRRFAGEINPAGDADLYSFSASQGELVVFDLYSAFNSQGDQLAWGSALFPRIQVLDGGGSVLSSVDGFISSARAVGTSAATESATLAFLAPVAGAYYVRVDDRNGGGSLNHGYFVHRR